VTEGIDLFVIYILLGASPYANALRSIKAGWGRETRNILIVRKLHSMDRRARYCVACVREPTILTEQPPLGGEVSANFYGWCHVVSITDPYGLF
jgi:hypothetical protein